MGVRDVYYLLIFDSRHLNYAFASWSEMRRDLACQPPKYACEHRTCVERDPQTNSLQPESVPSLRIHQQPYSEKYSSLEHIKEVLAKYVANGSSSTGEDPGRTSQRHCPQCAVDRLPSIMYADGMYATHYGHQDLAKQWQTSPSAGKTDHEKWLWAGSPNLSFQQLRTLYISSIWRRYNISSVRLLHQEPFKVHECLCLDDLQCRGLCSNGNHWTTYGAQSGDVTHFLVSHPQWGCRVSASLTT